MARGPGTSSRWRRATARRPHRRVPAVVGRTRPDIAPSSRHVDAHPMADLEEPRGQRPLGSKRATRAPPAGTSAAPRRRPARGRTGAVGRRRAAGCSTTSSSPRHSRLRPALGFRRRPPRHGSCVAYTSREMQASAAEAFAVLIDPETYPRWLVGAKQIRDVDTGWPSPGSRFHHVVGVGPLQIPDNTEVLDIQPGRMLKLRVRARPVRVGRGHVHGRR